MIWLVVETLMLMAVAVAVGIFVGALARQFLAPAERVPPRASDAGGAPGGDDALSPTEPAAEAAPVDATAPETMEAAIEAAAAEAEAVVRDLDRPAADPRP